MIWEERVLFYLGVSGFQKIHGTRYGKEPFSQNLRNILIRLAEPFISLRFFVSYSLRYSSFYFILFRFVFLFGGPSTCLWLYFSPIDSVWLRVWFIPMNSFICVQVEVTFLFCFYSNNLGFIGVYFLCRLLGRFTRHCSTWWASWSIDPSTSGLKRLWILRIFIHIYLHVIGLDVL